MNDNIPLAKLPEPDPHGQAAYLLTESLIHTLIEHSVLPLALAIDTVDVASDVRAEIAYDLGDTPTAMDQSLALLRGLSASLRADEPRDPHGSLIHDANS